jgi:predicted amidophosphoribosyltransferase
MRVIPHWRKATWAAVIWTVLMAFWTFTGSTATMGAGLGIVLLFLVWFVGFVVLSLIWLMSRPQQRLCPVCGEPVKKGLTVCRKCGHNFAAALGKPAAALEPRCPRCHKPIAIDQPTCGNCGMTITWGTQPPPQ